MREFQPTNVLTRDDTFLGICEAIGGISDQPVPLRSRSSDLVWSPLAAIAPMRLWASGRSVASIAPNPRRALAVAGFADGRCRDNDSGRETLAAAPTSMGTVTVTVPPAR